MAKPSEGGWSRGDHGRCGGRRYGRRGASGRLAAGAVVLLVLAGCSTSSGSSAPTTADGGAGASGTGAGSAGSASAGSASEGRPQPVWQRVAAYVSPTESLRTAMVRLYPLQRLEGRILLTVDLTPQNQVAAGLDYFCRDGAVCRNLGGINLYDSRQLIRYPPLRRTADPGSDFLSSSLNTFDLQPGTTYRFGAFFPDPGGSSTTVDLLLGGVAADVPIVDGGAPAADLVVDQDRGLDSVAPVTKGPEGTKLVVWPVHRPSSTAVALPHHLTAKVVGGTVNEGAGPSGVVSINADVLFAFDSASLTARAKVLIAQAAQVLAAKADPAKGVAVVGYTDSKGGDLYNSRLSASRAKAVAGALTSTGTLSGLALTSKGKGSSDPVAPNTLGAGIDNPEGRALNRRVEILYAPRAAATGTGTPSPAGTEASASVTSAPTAAGTPAAGADPTPAVTLPVRQQVAGQPQSFSAVVYPVRRLDNLTLVQADVIPVGTRAAGSDYFSAQGRGGHDTGALSLRDPATARVYVPAVDADPPLRFASTYLPSGLNKDTPFRLSFFTAALPAGLTGIDVQLGPLGTAKAVPVVDVP